MKLLASCTIAMTLLLMSCGKGKTTNTTSSKFTTLLEKQAFLEQYVTFRRSYEELHFHLSYIDGNSGMVAGPTEWNVRVLAVVPEGGLDQWIAGLSAVPTPEFSWTASIPQAPQDFGSFKWYGTDRVIVGIDRESRRVLYWNHTL